MSDHFNFFREIHPDEYSEMIHDRDEYFTNLGIEEIDDADPQKPLIEEKEYDYVFLFDALRYGAMEIALGDEYDVEFYKTNGTHTPVWLKNTWTDEHPEITYVSGTPMTIPDLEIGDIDYTPYMPDKVGKLIQATKDDTSKESAYSNQLRTTLPKDLISISENEDPPVFVHLMQPHTPFIGDVKLHSTYRINEVDIHGGQQRFYSFVHKDMIDVQLVRLAYWTNFLRALEKVDEFLSKHEDLTVVLTADHGEVLYQDRCSHGGENDPENQIVPWVEIEI